MAVMRALLITPSSPYPPHQGAALRNYGILHSLARYGMRPDLLTFCRDDAPLPAPLIALCDQVITVPAPQRSALARVRTLLTSDQPDLAARLASPAFEAALTRLLAEHEYDVIQFEGLEVAAYMPLARRLAPKTQMIYDAHNAEFALQRNIAHVEWRTPRRLPVALYSQTQAARIARFESAICAMSSAVITVSDEDAALFHHTLGVSTPIFTLPNGIFADEYAVQPASALNLRGQPIVFTGKMDYRPNVDAIQWFSEAVFPLVRAACPEAHLYVVGQSVHRDLLALETNGSHIAFTRWVESVQPFLHGAQVFIAPLRMGSGTRLKILEAMAAGCAIVATSTAIAGLDDGVRRALIVEDDAIAFANAINYLLAHPDERARLAGTASAFVRTHHDWAVLAPQLKTIYDAVRLQAR
jgi:glycosyltransferase involved in cell wall biosynthesis